MRFWQICGKIKAVKKCLPILLGYVLTYKQAQHIVYAILGPVDKYHAMKSL